MEKYQLKKVKKYIKEDRPSKLKSFVKKHRLCVKDVELSKGRSLLHYCCQHGSGMILRFLLCEGINPVEPDHYGNLPLHVCLRRALDEDTTEAKEVYTELVLPLLETAPEGLEEKNLDHVTCRELLEEVVSRTNEETPHGGVSDAEWTERLGEEMAREEEDQWGRYQPDNDYWEERRHESYDQWADRLYSDHKLKHKHYSQHHQTRKPDHHSKQKPQKPSGVIDEEELRKTREKLKRKYEENQKRDIEHRKTRRKSVYEKNFKSLLKNTDSQLTFSDIPWPSKGSMSDAIDVLFSGVDRSSSDFKRLLREQKVRWHPDKFTQKFGKRLVDADKSKIMEKVKEISQALNKLSDTLPV